MQTNAGAEAPSLKEATLNLLTDNVCESIFPQQYVQSQLCTSQAGKVMFTPRSFAVGNCKRAKREFFAVCLLDEHDSHTGIMQGL